MNSPRPTWFGLWLLLLLPRAAAADEAYYMITFGSQMPIYFQANHTHSFAVFVRAHHDGSGQKCILESFAISWMPQSMQVRVGKLQPEPGVNLDIYTTLNWALCDGQRVSRWGPFLIEKELYDRAVAQQAHLNSGAVRYKTVDTGYTTFRVSNCIHALGDLLYDAPRLRIGTPTWGQAGSYFITLHLGRWIIDPHTTHEWVMDALALSNYPIVARHLRDRNPTMRPVLRATQSLLRAGMRQNLRNCASPSTAPPSCPVPHHGGQ